MRLGVYFVRLCGSFVPRSFTKLKEVSQRFMKFDRCATWCVLSATLWFFCSTKFHKVKKKLHKVLRSLIVVRLGVYLVRLCGSFVSRCRMCMAVKLNKPNQDRFTSIFWFCQRNHQQKVQPGVQQNEKYPLEFLFWAKVQ